MKNGFSVQVSPDSIGRSLLEADEASALSALARIWRSKSRGHFISCLSHCQVSV